jgi:hypothetical protein
VAIPVGSTTVALDSDDPELPPDVEVMIGTFRRTMVEVQTGLARCPTGPLSDTIRMLVESGKSRASEPQAVVLDPENPGMVLIDPMHKLSLDRLARHREAWGCGAEPARVLPDPDAVLTVVEVADLLSLPRKTVTAMAAGGTKTPFARDGVSKAGRRWRVMGWAVRRLFDGDYDGEMERRSPEVRPMAEANLHQGEADHADVPRQQGGRGRLRSPTKGRTRPSPGETRDRLRIRNLLR